MHEIGVENLSKLDKTAGIGSVLQSFFAMKTSLGQAVLYLRQQGIYLFNNVLDRN